ncbi:MAG: AmmeMemoRadiSam system protein B [Thermoclostridium sp.]|nr:AmmeMemoRadiSam system protein B [Thermoclostridium sp.]
MKTKLTAWVLLIVVIVFSAAPGCNRAGRELQSTTGGTPEVLPGKEGNRQTAPNSLPASQQTETALERVERQKPELPLISCQYFDEASFRNAVSTAIAYEADISDLKGGIVPHHLLASTMIASFWKTVSQQKYDLVVILGPDHFRKGNTAISTLSSGFSTIFGDVYTDDNLVNALVQQNFASVQPELMESDHTISSHMPFFSYYMPDTPILPLLVKGNCDAGKIEALSNWFLETLKDKKVLFVASMDFSHYLPLEIANEKDEYTEKALRDFDDEKIAQMTNDHLDSRPSALFLLKTMSCLNAKEIEKWDHSNSDIISKANTGYTTSYFLFGFFADAQDEPMTAARRVNIIAAGDIMLGRGVASSLKARGASFLYPFLEVKSILQEGEFIFANLENPLTDRKESLDAQSKIILKAQPEAVSGLAFAGFNIVSVANNHMMDYYEDGLTDTMKILETNQILHAGAGESLQQAREPAIAEKNGVKMGVLAYTEMAEMVHRGNPSIKFAAGINQAGVAPLQLKRIEEDIRALRDEVDILAVSLHWGVEDSCEVTPEQVEMAHQICDFGADMILGHHPHRFQGIEIYNGKPIIYSLGNFIFDQVPENQESFLLQLSWEGSSFIELKAIPVRTVDHCQIIPQKNKAAQEMLQHQIQLSADLGTSCTLEDDALVYTVN